MHRVIDWNRKTTALCSCKGAKWSSTGRSLIFTFWMYPPWLIFPTLLSLIKLPCMKRLRGLSFRLMLCSFVFVPDSEAQETLWCAKLLKWIVELPFENSVSFGWEPRDWLLKRLQWSRSRCVNYVSHLTGNMWRRTAKARELFSDILMLGSYAPTLTSRFSNFVHLVVDKEYVMDK